MKTNYCRNCEFIRQDKECKIYCVLDNELVLLNGVCKNWKMDNKLKGEDK